MEINNKSYELRWDILHKIGELKNIGKTCKTCNLKKIEITLANKERSLDKRQELFKHVHTLKNYTSKLKLFITVIFVCAYSSLPTYFVKSHFYFVSFKAISKTVLNILIFVSIMVKIFKAHFCQFLLFLILSNSNIKCISFVFFSLISLIILHYLINCPLPFLLFIFTL